jgi:hypothetical protein
MITKKMCVLCSKPGEELLGFNICSRCKDRLSLFTDTTISGHVQQMKEMGNHSFEAEVKNRLMYLEKDYIKKKIKLLHILSRLKEIK